jgi:FMN reductase
MAMQVTIVVGNPKLKSRTREVAEAVAAATFPSADVSVVELSEYAEELFSWSSERVKELVASVACTDVLVVASPTYKATYTGLTKAFLDHYPAGSLADVVAIPVMTGADRTHALGVDTTLVPLLTELGAIVVARGSYFVTDDMAALPEFANAAGRRYAAAIQTVARLSGSKGVAS